MDLQRRQQSVEAKISKTATHRMYELYRLYQIFLLPFSPALGTLQLRCGTFAMAIIYGQSTIIVRMFTGLLCIRTGLSFFLPAHETLQFEHSRSMALFSLSR